MKKGSKKKKGGKGKRRASKAQLLALAKGQAALGNHAAAAKLRARAGGRSANPAKGTGKGKGRKGAAAPAAAAAAPAKKRGGGRPRKPKTVNERKTVTTETTRTSNPGRGGRKIAVTLTSTGKGSKKRMKANVGQLKAAVKGQGRYLDLSTGAIKKASQINRSANPSISTKGILSISAGVVIGAPIAEAIYRYAATRPGAYGETKREDGWTGRDAMMRINAGSGKCLAFVGFLGVVVGGAGFAMLGASPVVGGFLFGVGVAHVGVAATRGFLMLIGRFNDKDNKGIGNRLAPEFAELEESYKTQIESLNAALSGTGESTGGDDAVSGSVADVRRRLKEARQRNRGGTALSGTGEASPVLSRALQDLRAQALGAVEQIPAVAGCSGDCAEGESCGPDCCNDKRQGLAGNDAPKAEAPKVEAPKAAPVEPPAAPAPPALPAPAPRISLPEPSRAPAWATPFGNLSNPLRRVA